MIFFLIILIISFLFIFHIKTKKYINPYKLTMIFGKKGSGKSTLLTKIALDYVKRGYDVYTNTYCPGTKLISTDDIGHYAFPENSVILLDEVGMIWDNRHFKNFSNEVRDFFKLQRHYKLRVYLFSQTFDIDKKIRDLTDDMFLVERRMRVFSYSKRILKKTVLNKSSSEAPSKIDEDLVFDSLLFFWLGSRKLTYLPRYSEFFDSFDTPKLPEINVVEQELNCPVKSRKFRFLNK